MYVTEIDALASVQSNVEMTGVACTDAYIHIHTHGHIYYAHIQSWLGWRYAQKASENQSKIKGSYFTLSIISPEVNR